MVLIAPLDCRLPAVAEPTENRKRSSAAPVYVPAAVTEALDRPDHDGVDGPNPPVRVVVLIASAELNVLATPLTGACLVVTVRSPSSSLDQVTGALAVATPRPFALFSRSSADAINRWALRRDCCIAAVSTTGFATAKLLAAVATIGPRSAGAVVNVADRRAAVPILVASMRMGRTVRVEGAGEPRAVEPSRSGGWSCRSVRRRTQGSVAVGRSRSVVRVRTVHPTKPRLGSRRIPDADHLFRTARRSSVSAHTVRATSDLATRAGRWERARTRRCGGTVAAPQYREVPAMPPAPRAGTLDLTC